MRKIYFPLLIMILLSLTTCEREDFEFDRSKQETNIGSIVIPGTTKIVEGNDLTGLREYDGEKLTFSENTQFTNDLRNGDVLMIGVSEKTPYGLLRKVSKIEKMGSDIVLTTSEASLEEAIKEGSVSFSKVLTIDDIQSSTLKKGVMINESKSLDGIGFDLDQIVLFENNGLKVLIDGGISVVPEIDVNLDFALFKIKKIEVITKLTKTEDFTVTANFNFTDSKEVELARFVFSPIVVYGIVLVPIVTINVGIEGEIYSEVVTSVFQERTLTNTLTYENENWTRSTEKTKQFNWLAPQLTANAILKAYGGPKLNIMIFGIVGPYVQATGFIELTADVEWPKWWKLEAGIEGEVGVNFGIFGDGEDFNWPIEGISETIAEASGPFFDGADISGTVADFATGQTMHGVNVTVFQGDINSRITIDEAITDENGFYSLRVAEGTGYKIEFIKEGYLPTLFNIGEVIEGYNYSVNAVLSQSINTGELKGTVLDAITNNPLEGVMVKVLKDGEVLSIGLTDADGKYGFTLPAFNNYTIEFIKGNYQTVSRYNVEILEGIDNFIEVILQIDDEHLGLGDFGGILSNAFTGTPESGVTLKLRKELSNWVGEIIGTTVSSSSGSYLFSQVEAGNYTIEVSKDGYITNYFSALCIGEASTGNQNGTISPEIGENEVRIILTWGENPSDLDSHLTGPAGGSDRFHIYYSNKTYGDINLDVDDIDSYGPETVTIPNLNDGLYRYSIHNYSDRNSISSQSLSFSEAKVVVFIGSQLIATYSVPNQEGTLWTVFEIYQNQIIPINAMEYTAYPSTITKSENNQSDRILIKDVPEKNN